jgi:hypothetical protein
MRVHHVLLLVSVPDREKKDKESGKGWGLLSLSQQKGEGKTNKIKWKQKTVHGPF